MLVILSSLPDASEAAQTAQRALAAAARPTGLRFAVPEACREGFGQGDALFYSGEEPLEAVLPLLTDETFFLHLMGAHGFAPKWDARLYAALRHVCGPALLSASVSPPVEGTPEPVADADADTRVYDRAALGAAQLPQPAVEAEACLPALADRFEDNAVQIVRGLPLVCAASPVRTLTADPALLLGPVDFLRKAEPALATLSIAAYVAGFSVYALPDTPLWPLAEPPSDGFAALYPMRCPAPRSAGLSSWRASAMTGKGRAYAQHGGCLAWITPIPSACREGCG